MTRRWAAGVLVAASLVAAGCSGHDRRATAPPRRSAPPSSPATGPPTSTSVTSTPTPAPHVMVIVLENREASAVLGGKAPFFDDLARRFGEATAAYGTTHPSLPNYLELIAGTTFGITSDCTSCSVEGRTLVDQLDDRGIPWRAYMEGITAPCPTASSTAAGYAKKHDPFVYVRHLAADPTACGRVVPADRFAADLAAKDPPAFMWYTPNLCNDGHDCSTATSDAWLATTVRRVMASPWYRAGAAIVITYDEGTTSASCCESAHGGRIATVVVSTTGAAGARVTTPVDHAGMLRTIETLYGLDYLGDAACPCAGSLVSLVRPR